MGCSASTSGSRPQAERPPEGERRPRDEAARPAAATWEEMAVPVRNGQTAANLFGLTEPQLLAVALAVAALRASGQVPLAGTSLEIDLAGPPAGGLAGRGLSTPD